MNLALIINMFNPNIQLLVNPASFSLSNLVVRFANQLYALVIMLLFVYHKSICTSLLLISVLIYNYLNFKIRLTERDQIQRYIQSNQTTKINCLYRERIFFFVIVCLNCAFLLLKIFHFFMKYMIYSRKEDTILDLFKQLSCFLLVDSDILDLLLLLVVTPVSFGFYLMNRRLRIYYDYYFFKIANTLYSSFLTTLLLLAVTAIIAVKITMLFTLTIMGMAESFIIVALILNIFIKYKGIVNASLKTPVNILKYLVAGKIFCIAVLVILANIIDIDVEAKILSIVSNEMSCAKNPNNLNLHLTMLLYLLLNYYSYITKFSNTFRIRVNKTPYPELYQRPYRLHFIKYFARRLMAILRIKNIETNIDLNLDLKADFYKDLKNHVYFKKSFDYSHKPLFEAEKLPVKFWLYAQWRKYYMIFKVYRIDVGLFILNALMLLYLAFYFYDINLLSVFYFALSITIIIFNELNIIWSSSLVFCILPNMLMILLNSFYYFYMRLFEGENYEDSFGRIYRLLGFDSNPNLIERNVSTELVAISLNTIYLICYARLWKQKEKKGKVAVMQSLRNQRHSVLDADEDLMFIFQTLFKYGLIALKLYIIYNILMEVLTYVNVSNTIIITSLLAYFVFNTPVLFECFCNVMLSIFALRFFSRYKLVFGVYEDHFNLLYGFYFNVPEINTETTLKEIQDSQRYLFYCNFIMIYILFVIKNRLELIKKNRLVSNRIFKTKYLSDVYSYLAELFMHSKNVIDSTKIFFVYFSVYYFATKLTSHSYFSFFECIFITAMLIFHMYIFKRQGDVNNKMFLLAFCGYFLFLMVFFIILYKHRFDIYVSIDLNNQNSTYNIQEFYKNNKKVLLPFVIKIFLCIIALKALLKEYLGLGEVENERLKKLLKDKESLKTRLYYRLFKILAVFIKEILLLSIAFGFLNNPNIFKLAYLAVYLYYFFHQIKSLLRVMTMLKFPEILKAKGLFIKRVYISNTAMPYSSAIDYYDPIFCKLGSYYFELMSRKIFNKIHRKVNKTWIWMFSIIIFYMCSILLRFIIINNDKTMNFIFQYLFKGENIDHKYLNEELKKLIIVLFITVIEIYFIDILKTEEIKDQNKCIRLITNILLRRYNLMAYRASQASKGIAEEPDEVESAKELYGMVKELSSHDMRKYNFDVDNASNASFSVVGNPILTNINQRASEVEKSLLIHESRVKLCFLDCVRGLLMSFRRFIMIPVILGILYTTNLSPFALAVLAVLYLSLFPEEFDHSLKVVNSILVILCLSEYLLLYTCDIWSSSIHEGNYEFLINIVEKLKRNPLSCMPYIFLYAGIVKAFFLFLILLTKYSMVVLDEINPAFFKKVKKLCTNRNTYHVIDYKNWIRSPFFVFMRIKHNFLLSFADIFFVLSFIFYFNASGILIWMAICLLFGLKICFNIIFKESFSKSLAPAYIKYYKCLITINWLILINTQYQLYEGSEIIAFEIQYKVLLAITLVLNMLILDCAKSGEILKECRKAYQYFQIKNRLSIIETVYNFNEATIVNNINAYAKKEALQFKYTELDIHTEKKASFSVINLHEMDINAMSVFVTADSYKDYLYNLLGVWHASIVRCKLAIRNKLLEGSLVSPNIFSSLVGYMTKNKGYLGNRPIDLFKMASGNYTDILNIFEVVEANNKIYTNREYVYTLKEKLKEVEASIIYARSKSPTLSRSPLIRRESSANTSRAVNYLVNKLTSDDQVKRLAHAPPNTFVDNMLKHQINDWEFMVIKDFDEVSRKINDFKFINFDIREYATAFWSLVNLKLELIVNVCLIIIFSFTEGFMGPIYVSVLIFFIMIENKVKNINSWQLCYFLFMMNFICQLIVNKAWKIVPFNEEWDDEVGELPTERQMQLVMFVYGKIRYSYTIIIFIIFEFILTHLCDNFNMDKTFTEIENPSQCVFRLTFNSSWQYLYNQKNNRLMCDINLIEAAVKKKYKDRLKKQEYMVFVINLIKRKTALYRLYRDKFISFLELLLRVVPLYNKDKLRYNSEKFGSYFWRNFNLFLRKPGYNYHNYLMLIISVIMIYFFIFFYNLQGSNKSIMEVFTNNEVNATLGINLSIIFFCLCAERFYYSKLDFRWIESTDTERDNVINIIRHKNINFELLKERAIMPLTKLKLTVKKIMAVGRLTKPSTEKIKDEYKYNPLIQRFYFSIAFWLYIVVLVFVWLPYSGHQHLTQEIKLNKLFCNDTYRTKYEKEPLYACNNYSTNIYLKILFLLANLYLMVSILQVYQGFSSLLYMETVNYYKFKELIKFFAYKYMPFIRELKTILDYAASTTALNLFQWFKLEDIETTIMTAKVNEIFNQYRGTKMDKVIKRFTGFFFLIFFFLLLIGPLYVFSDLAPNSDIDEINNANVNIKGKIKGNSFELFSSGRFKIKQISDLSIQYKYLKEIDNLKKYEANLYRNVIFNKNSEKYFETTPETIRHIRESFDTIKTVEVEVDLTLETRIKGQFTRSYSFELNENDGEVLLSMLTTKNCEGYLNKRLLLGETNKFVDIKKRSQSSEINDKKNFFTFSFMLRYACNVQNNKIFFELSDENFENVDFIVLSENIKNSVEMLQRFSTNSNVSLFSIYAIIFSYVGLTIIRKAFFDQAHKIWTTDIPRAHKLEEYAYLILYARIKGDLYNEEMFYNKLIDLFRAPEKIKELTGSIVNLKNFKHKLNVE